MIFAFYFGHFKIGEVYPSKFRKDRNPSTGFYISSSGKLIYNDLSTREKTDCFAFVCKLYNISFRDAIKRIALDFGLIQGNPTPMSDKVLAALQNFDKGHKKETGIHFVADKWGVENLAFWKEYHLGKSELKGASIYPIKKLYINEVFIPNKSNTQRYALTVVHKGEMLTKVYSPDSQDTLKWVSNIPLDVPFGLDELNWSAPFSFTGKAQKDRLVLLKFMPGAVIASQNETLSAMPLKLRNKLKFHFRKNYCGWDNDETGVDGMIEMGNEGFEPVYVWADYFEKYGIKDFSDLAKAKGLGEVERLLKEYKVI